MKKFNLNSSLKNKLVILLYHGVTEDENTGIINYQGKHINHIEFEKQISFVSKNCSLISIDDWLQIKKSDSEVPPYPTIISFDDGFKNNLSVAAPILKKYSAPCIFYISSGMIDSEKMFWVDIVEACIDSTSKASITLNLDQKITYNLISHEDKVRALLDIKKYCKLSKNSQKNDVINELIEATEINPDKKSHVNYQTLNWDEVRQLNSNQLFTIGGHTHTHTILSSLEKDDLKYEIKHCLKKIAKELDQDILHFSYPEGQAHHYNDEVIRILKENGIICCPSAVNGVNDYSEDFFHFKRVMVGFENTPFPHQIS